jgi:DNA (cytosine-5)-methyltransferase 1
MNVGSLFTGIGGFDLGLERAGMRVAWQCESNEYRRKVLALRWPEVPCYDDVRALVADSDSGGWPQPQQGRQADSDSNADALLPSEHDGAGGLVPVPVPYVDVLCGGFPCQDLSLAGKGAGIEGSRSGLWREFARLIGELRPRYVIVENVPALTFRGLDRVLADLAACGFDAEWDHLPAAAFGAPHRRDRLWLVAYPGGNGCGDGQRGPDGYERQALVGPRDAGQLRGDQRGDGRRSGGPSLQAIGGSRDGEVEVADAEGKREQLWTAAGERSRRLAGGGAADSNGQPQVRLAESRGERGYWSVEPDVGRVVARLSPWLDGGRVDESEGTREILRALREPNEAQTLQWTARGHGGVQAAAVLLAALCEPAGPSEALGDLSLASATAPQIVMRSVWVDGGAACPSCRRAAREQRAEQHPDALRVLPQLLACDCGAARLDPTGTPTAARNRVDRLSSLGDSLVPQVAEWIGRRIMEWERSREREAA